MVLVVEGGWQHRCSRPGSALDPYGSMIRQRGKAELNFRVLGKKGA